MFRVKGGIVERQIVATPALSMTFDTSPTDRLQNGQTGTSSTTSTWSARSSAANRGAVAETSSVLSRM